MALFEFELKPLQSVEPWGEPNDPNLHWFGLTDGYYFLNANGHELYRYTEEILAHWSKQNVSVDPKFPYPDYQIVRLYEDFLDILSCVNQSIPDYIFDRIGNLNLFEQFICRVNDLCNNEDDAINDKIEQINTFLWSRRLDSGHLTQGPNIWFFRNKDEMYLRWLNGDKTIDGIPVWSEIKGEVKFPYVDFVKEVYGFHERLMDKMEIRVRDVLSGKLDPRIRIDFKGLEIEQENRKKSLAESLDQKCQFQEWERIEMSLKEFNSF